MRKSGVLLAISSLPSKYGIGTFSKEAYDFVDFLEESGESLWQILPLGPTGYGDSPYQSFSTFAGNPYYIDLEEFIQKGWLTDKECSAYNYGHPEYVEYEVIFKSRFKLLRMAFERSNVLEDEDYKSFVEENSFWLDDYALYMAIKDSMGGKSWLEWNKELKTRKPEAVNKAKKELKKDIDFYCFQQYYFAKQWAKLKGYANEKGIQIVGDLPIYVALDGSDTWANPKLFELDEDCNPINVAGCPPDCFTADGQLWGNPLYTWDYHKKTGYDWWMKRIGRCYKLYDIIRIDHFRGFDEYYSIKYGMENARIGEWKPGPGYELFDVMKKTFGKKPIIAEDLGFITDSVRKLVKKTGFPNMKILLFAFEDSAESEHLPYNYSKNMVAYTGTHDNDTVAGWWTTLNRKDKAFAKKYLQIRSPKEAPEKMVICCKQSPADTAICPMQDILGLGNEARMNLPSTVGTNWKWRLKADALTPELASKLRDMNRTYGRIPR